MSTPTTPTPIQKLTIRLRTQIRDNGKTQETQAFPDDIDTSAPPKIIPGSSPELQQFIQSAIAIYSRYRSLKKPITITLEPGKLEYDLPDDWMSADIESFNKTINPDPVPDLSLYALPWVQPNLTLNMQLNKIGYLWYDDAWKMVLKSAITTQASVNLVFDYNAYHIANDSETTIPLWKQDYVIYKSAELALRVLATEKGVALQKYRVGSKLGMEIDDSKIAENLLNQAEKYEEQFRKEVILRPFATSGGDDTQPWV